MPPTRLVTIPQVSLSLASDVNEARDDSAPPLFIGSLSLDLVTSPPSLPPRPNASSSSLSSSYHGAIPGGFQPSRSPSPSPSPSLRSPPSPPTTKYLKLSLSLPNDEEPIFTMPVGTDTYQTTPNHSYLIPNLSGSDPSSLDSQPSSPRNGYIKLTFPSSMSGEEREHFESILASGGIGFDETSSTTPPLFETLERNQLYVVDEKNGTVLGQLDNGGTGGNANGAGQGNHIELQEDSLLSSGQMQDDTPANKKTEIDMFNIDGKEAVVINSLEPSSSSSSSGPTWNASRFSVKPLSSYYSPAPNPSSSTIIAAANFISHGLVIGSSLISQGLEKGAGAYVSTRPATNTPLVFKDATKERWVNGSRVTGKAVVYSGKASGYVGQFATQIGDRIGKATGIQTKPGDPPPSGLKGLVVKSLIAINTVGDHLDASGKTLLESGSKSASQVVHHKWGGEARGIADDAGNSVKHCALVYIDARGVTRRALIKAVGKGALKAKMADGSQLYLTDSTDTSEYELQQIERAATTGTASTNPFDDKQQKQLTNNGAAGGASSPPPSYSNNMNASSASSVRSVGSGASTPNMLGGYPTTYNADTQRQQRKDQ